MLNEKYRSGLRRFKHLLTRNYMRAYSLNHKIQKKMVFVSFEGKQYSDNPKAVSVKMHQLFPEYKIVWILNTENIDSDFLPSYIKVVKPGSPQAYAEIATAFCYITNGNNEPNIIKRKGQFFVQTWHGDRVPKKVLYDTWGSDYRAIPVTDNEITDLCIAASDIGESAYRTAFRYSGPVLRVGMPRNDKLVIPNTDEQIKVKKHLGIQDDEKILLYAPTFRDHMSEKQNINVDLDSVLEKLSNTGEKWKCLLRAHSASKGLILDNLSDRYLDVTSYPDMADLLLVADMLITDYSSSAGDFILRRKPVILTMFDLDYYKNNCRDFNFFPGDVGFIVAYNQEELLHIIDTYGEDDYR